MKRSSEQDKIGHVWFAMRIGNGMDWRIRLYSLMYLVCNGNRNQNGIWILEKNKKFYFENWGISFPPKMGMQLLQPKARMAIIESNSLQSIMPSKRRITRILEIKPITSSSYFKSNTRHQQWCPFCCLDKNLSNEMSTSASSYPRLV